MEVPDVRRRLRGAIEEARRRAADRRVRIDEASRQYEEFLTRAAAPAFRAVAQALAGEGHRFKVLTPGQAVRLVAEFSADDWIELALDTSRDDPALVVTASRGRGRRSVTTERAILEDRAIADVGEDDVIEVLLREIVPLVER
jgi:hypothetical protein